MSKKATKKTAKKKPVENKPAAPDTPKTLDELLKPHNDYERLIVEHVRGRHDAALEAAIVEHQRSINDCLRYVVSCAQKKHSRSQCVMMTDDEVYGLAVHFFLDGNTPTATPGARYDLAENVPAAQTKKPDKKAPAKKQKPKTAKKPDKPDDGQMLFDFCMEATA